MQDTLLETTINANIIQQHNVPEGMRHVEFPICIHVTFKYRSGNCYIYEGLTELFTMTVNVDWNSILNNLEIGCKTFEYDNITFKLAQTNVDLEPELTRSAYRMLGS